MNSEASRLREETQKAEAVIYGLSIGDALGRPVEFLSYQQIIDCYGRKGIIDLPKGGMYTDDTQLSIAVAEALISAGDKDLETYMSALFKQLVKWYRSPDNNRAPGQTCLKAVGHMEEGLHWKKSGIPHSRGCGSAMRSSPLGYFFESEPYLMERYAYATGVCTHGHPAAVAASIGQAYLVKLALEKTRPIDMIPKLLSFTNGISDDFDHIINKMKDLLYWENQKEAIDHIGSGWDGDEAVALCLYCFIKNSDDYEKAIIRGANIDGDSDSIASMTGALTASYLGIESIPERWVRSVENSTYLKELAFRLAQKKVETFF